MTKQNCSREDRQGVAPIRHVILELYCVPNEESSSTPYLSCTCHIEGVSPGLHCFVSGPEQQRCPYLLFSPAEFEIAYAGECGDIGANDWIGFGGDMIPPNAGGELQPLQAVWQAICRRAITAAYAEYKAAITEMKE